SISMASTSAAAQARSTVDGMASATAMPAWTEPNSQPVPVPPGGGTSRQRGGPAGVGPGCPRCAQAAMPSGPSAPSAGPAARAPTQRRRDLEMGSEMGSDSIFEKMESDPISGPFEAQKPAAQPSRRLSLAAA